MKFRCFLFSLMLCLLVLPTSARAVSCDTLNPLPSITDDRVLKLLTSDPVFLENWINNITFTYDSVRASDLPEMTIIPLLQPGEKFTPTWYGRLSSGYKWRWGRQHHGVDLVLKTGDTIYAAWEGVVRYAQWNKSGYGNCVVIRHKNGLETLYAHMSKLLVSPNQYVNSGESLGLGGSTGNSTGPHLHFEIRYKDFSINPELIIDYSTRTLKLDTFQFVRANISGSRYSGDINTTPGNLPPQSDSVARVLNNSIQTEAGGDKKPSLPPTNPTGKNPEPDTEVKKKSTPPPSTSGDKKKKKAVASKKLPTTYVVKKGDTYTSIAKKNGVTIAALKKLNPKQNETRLMPGQKIRIR
ncbi:MAG: LysM peptidoglycan-binding domain-containing protein [Bacteroidetes bacterium]|nr:LysM peptidoglycan-binding domain-containing protein [Bacteroidota bacterium]